MNSRNLPSTSFAWTWSGTCGACCFRRCWRRRFWFGLCQPGLAQYEALDLGPEEAAPALPAAGVTLFQNVRIFDGKNAALSAPSSVLVRGNIIEQISASPAAAEAGADVRVINANGRVLMPGLIDAHWHMFMAAVSPAVLADGGSRLPQSVGCATGRSNADAGFHHHTRHGWSGVWIEARHRRGRHRWSAHLSFGRDDLANLGPWRLSVSLRGSAGTGRAVEPVRAHGRRSHCRQPR